MNLRPLGYEPNELPGCSTPRQGSEKIAPLLRCVKGNSLLATPQFLRGGRGGAWGRERTPRGETRGAWGSGERERVEVAAG